ncbi:hypothetical protein BDZ94DRAFT_1322758 [Collybia nuda]|uniref:U1-type domain-containing protein n=1 Tax=Collybia nuda TaxID=64659 RepID=A0A9P5Y4R6_9AGAR|nr:hypothetical protein BDZ94DRAFT_1322758 [Collybia nuda]
MARRISITPQWVCPTCHTKRPEYLREIHLKCCPMALASRRVVINGQKDFWECIQCDIQMSVSNKGSHLAGKRHQKAIQNSGHTQDMVADFAGLTTSIPTIGEKGDQSSALRDHTEVPETPKPNGKKGRHGEEAGKGPGGFENQGRGGATGPQRRGGATGPQSSGGGDGARTQVKGKGKGKPRSVGPGGGGGGSGGGGGGGGGGSSRKGRRMQVDIISDEEARSILYDIDTAFGLLPHGGAYKESDYYDDYGNVLY